MGNDPTRVRFGPYEADLRTHELWKFGTKLKLVGQPFEILAVLVSRPGELVTRDELRSRLWPAETFVDFNHGLNAAVNKLREALSDSADNPRYIETLPRRGYRFIGKLESPSEPPSPAPEPAAQPSASRTPEVSAIEPMAAAPAAVRVPARSGLVLKILLAVAFFGVLLIGGSAFLHLAMRENTPSVPPVAMRGWQKTLVSGPARYEGPQFSPDGNKIVFMSDRSGGLDLWTCDADGNNLQQITTIGNAGTPRWSPDGKLVAFDSRLHNYGGLLDGARATEGLGAVLVVEPGSGAQRFVIAGNSNNEVPSWSRDGKFIYFASDRSGSWQVWKAPVAGGSAVQVTRQGGFAAWESPDGKFVYYAKSEQPNPEIWRVPSGGGEESLVSAAVRPGTWASWSVDEDGIYFIGASVNNTPTLNYFEFSGQRLREFTLLDSFPFWFATSSDGKRALFTRQTVDGSSIVLMEDFRH